MLSQMVLKQGKSATLGAAPEAKAPLRVSLSRTAGAADSVSGQERRQEQRVLLKIRAQIHVVLQGKTTTLDVSTLSVNPCGALVLANQDLPTETLLVLEHSTTKQRVACRVVRSPQKTADGYHVPLQFDSPSPAFWKIDFPPADWRPED
jgi:hypothetical protein